MPESAPILCLDIGSGTQDVLLYFPDREIENCPKLVLPAPARVLAERLRAATAAGRAVHLHGCNSGGGFHGAVKAHLAAGLPLSATRAAAFSLADDLAALAATGVALREDCPDGALDLLCADYDPEFWARALDALGLGRVDAQLRLGPEDESGQGLAAGAGAVIVGADVDGIEGDAR